MPIFESHGIRGGVWTGVLRGDPRPARVCATCLGEVVAEASLTDTADGDCRVRLDLPASLISDGVATLVLVADPGEPGAPVSAASQRLDRVTLAAGKPLDQDLAAEISALRAEMDLLKREFRRLAASLRD